MRPFLVSLIAVSLFAAEPPKKETIQAFGMEWEVPFASEWSFQDGVLKMLKARPQEKDPRRPVQFALAKTQPYSDVEIDVEMKRDKGSMIIVYAWQQEGRFNYAHLSVDAPTKQPVHNGIFHCFGGDRVRISPLEGPSSLPTEEWTPVKLIYSAKTGEVRVWANNITTPALRGIDLSLGAGRIGLGSFFETGQFRNLRIKGKP